MQAAFGPGPAPYHRVPTLACRGRAQRARRKRAPTRRLITRWGTENMQPKRKVLTLALLSAGIGLATCSNFAFAASGAANGAQDQTQAQTQPPGTDQNAKNKKKNGKTTRKQQPEQLQVVQVNGFVSSIENSTALKRNASTIVEAVSAEQIGKLPGVSIADALGRLPGIAVQTV